MTPRKSTVRIEPLPTVPGCGSTCRLTVSRDGKIMDECVYAYTLVPCEIPDAVAVRWERLDLDREAVYHVLFEFPGGSRCECMAGARERVFCKHAEATRFLMARRLLPAPGTQKRTVKSQPIGV